MSFVSDAHGTIARIRKQLPPKGKVRKSKNCDLIIALRLQGNPFQKIHDKLVNDYNEYISVVALSQAFKNIQDGTFETPYVTDLIDRWGGSIDFDHVREQMELIVMQMRRINKMVKEEEDKNVAASTTFTGKKSTPSYNGNLRREMEVASAMMVHYHNMMKSPLDAANENIEADKLLANEMQVGEEKFDDMLMSFITEKIATGELSADNLIEDDDD